MLTFYDFEVFKYNWMVVLIDPEHLDKPIEVVDDPKKLESYYESHMTDIWVGFNSRHYDQYILKGILTGCNPWDINEHIITKHQPGCTEALGYPTHPSSQLVHIPGSQH